ncbi:MAG: potassium transporter TrkG [candidate division WOR-3 bacterium]
MEKKAALIVLGGYVLIALIGALILLLPISKVGSLNFVDALFTSTSALCVTGLIVKDTPVFFTAFGKAVILLLIQIGGIGYMTIVGIFLHRLRRSLMLPEMMAQGFPELKPGFAFYFARRVVIYTLMIEILGFFLLFLGFYKYFDSAASLKHAFFHSVSAFCNAGFSTFSDSLCRFRGDIFVNFVIIFLIVTGGLGFFAVHELRGYLTGQIKRLLGLTRKGIKGSIESVPGVYTKQKVHQTRFSTHTKSVLLWTFILIVAGFLFIFISEINGKYSYLPLKDKFLFSLFQSVTTRTCGFNTVHMGYLKPVTLVFIMLLMFIGGSPGGTAGGVKTNTFFIIFVWVFHYLKGYKNVYLFKRKVSEIVIEKAFIILIIAIVFNYFVFLTILLVDPKVLELHAPLEVLFEVISAFGTVGLSTGSKIYSAVSLSADFNVLSKCIIILTMLVGKVGVLTLATYIVEKAKVEIGYPEDRYIVG